MKKCPFCAEEIQPEAIKCKHCGEFLDGSQDVVRSAKRGPGWYFSPAIMFLGFLGVGPLMLPLVWLHPQYSRIKKIILTVIILGLSWILWQSAVASFKELKHYLDIIGGNSSAVGL